MPFGCYIHVPFCAKRCPYCDFAFVVRKAPQTGRYVEALVREIAAGTPEQADSLYLGGGTPSLLSPAQVQTILRAVPRKPGASVTLEANPAQHERFQALAEAGITRLSLGLQSLHDPHLAMLGRDHDAALARTALDAAAGAGFGSLNADLIFGVPGQTEADLLADARELAARGVQHVSAYGLTVHEGTQLAKSVRTGAFVPVDEEAGRSHFLALHECLTGLGFEHYEISNYARPGHRSFHNELYWTGAGYRGYGPSAHSFNPGKSERSWNERSLDPWLARVESGADATAGRETLTPAQRALERLFLGLRRAEGIGLADFPELAAMPMRRKISQLEEEGLVVSTQGRIALTAGGMVVADAVVELLAG